MSVPALYSHTTRSTGTTLTAAIYNADHTNHITNGTPAQLGSYSATSGEMQSATDPGAVGAESLASSLAGELERLRYFLKNSYGGAQWYSLAPAPDFCEGRLTLTTGVPVTTADVTAAETLYWTPYNGNRVSLYDGTSRWNVRTFSELSIDIPDATNCYDVFVYDNAGTAALELTAWTNETTRATALTRQNGVLVKTGATTRRYLGTFYSTTAGNGQVEDSYAKRNLWNYYHRVLRPMKVVEGTDTWNYTTATWRQANASTANQVEFVRGVEEDPVKVDVQGCASNSSVGLSAAVGVGIDATNANSATVLSGEQLQVAGQRQSLTARYVGYPGVGRHYAAWVEFSDATGTTTWLGDGGSSTIMQSGIVAELRG